MQWISVVVSGITLLGGIVTHFFFVREKIAVMKFQMDHLREEINRQKDYLPEIKQSIDEMKVAIEVIKVKMQ